MRVKTESIDESTDRCKKNIDGIEYVFYYPKYRGHNKADTKKNDCDKVR